MSSDLPLLLDLFCGAGGLRHGGYVPAPAVCRRLLGIDWMGWHGLTQSIPPDYTEWIGERLLQGALNHAAA